MNPNQPAVTQQQISVKHMARSEPLFDCLIAMVTVTRKRNRSLTQIYRFALGAHVLTCAANGKNGNVFTKELRMNEVKEKVRREVDCRAGC